MNDTQTKFKDSVVTALEEILDKMAFMVFEPVTPGALPSPEFAYSSHISFTGKISGNMTVFMTRPTAEELARNLIGIRKDDVLHTSTLEDAMREFSNILMGRALSLLSPEQHYDLQLPIAEPVTAATQVKDPDFRIEGMLNEVEPCRIDVNLS